MGFGNDMDVLTSSKSNLKALKSMVRCEFGKGFEKDQFHAGFWRREWVLYCANAVISGSALMPDTLGISDQKPNA